VNHQSPGTEESLRKNKNHDNMIKRKTESIN
jgi:hypothetical protein